MSLFHRYAQLCQNLLEENVETGEQFSQEFLPSLLYLLTDPVPNVRLSLARTLSQSVTVLGIVHLLQVIFMHSMSSEIVLEGHAYFYDYLFFLCSVKTNLFSLRWLKFSGILANAVSRISQVHVLPLHFILIWTLIKLDLILYLAYRSCNVHHKIHILVI